MLKRMWINQPSIYQPFHHMHGENILADFIDGVGATCTIYYLSGDVISSVVPKLFISDGWINRKDCNEKN